MYNILIVDDESLSRNTIRFMLNWEDYGFCLEGEVSSGEAAIEFLAEHHIDVVLADVSMPQMNGVELAEYINRTYPHISVVMLSNYSDFDYVRRAFQANVMDYVLKHSYEKETIIKLLKEIKIKLDANTVLPRDGADRFTQRLQYRNKIKSAILGSGSYRPERAMLLVAHIKGYSLRIHSYSLQERKFLLQNINNTIAQIIKDMKGFVVFEHSENIIIYLPFAPDVSDPEIMRTFHQYIRQISYSVYKFYNLTLNWGLSRLTAPDYTLRQCLDEAVTMLTNSPIVGQEKALDNSISYQPLSIEKEKQLLNAISELNLEKINQTLEEIFEGIESIKADDILIGELISILLKTCADFEISTADITPIDGSTSTVDSYLQWFQSCFAHIIREYAKISAENYQTRYITTAKDYIFQNYASNISLKEIAAHIGITEQYLCKIFKQQTGKTLTKFLTEYRIEQAKEFLKKGSVNLKYLYNRVGFNDYNYFFVVFKKHVGCTPSEFQKKHRQ